MVDSEDWIIYITRLDSRTQSGGDYDRVHKIILSQVEIYYFEHYSSLILTLDRLQNICQIKWKFRGLFGDHPSRWLSSLCGSFSSFRLNCGRNIPWSNQLLLPGCLWKLLRLQCHCGLQVCRRDVSWAFHKTSCQDDGEYRWES